MAWNYSRNNKFSNEKVKYDNFSFSSKLEASVYAILKAREQAGEIKFIQCQSRVKLTLAEIVYIADFRCLDLSTNQEFHVEAKGFATPEWAIKKRLWKWYGPNNLYIYRGSHKAPFLDEVIEVKNDRTG